MNDLASVASVGSEQHGCREDAGVEFWYRWQQGQGDQPQSPAATTESVNRALGSALSSQVNPEL